MTFTPEEWQVFFLIDGRRTVDEICRLVGNPDELATLRVLYRLLAAKFVALIAPPKEEPEAPAAPAGDKNLTQAFIDGKPLTPTGGVTPYSIEFQTALRVGPRTTRRRSSRRRRSSTRRAPSSTR